MKTKKVKNSVCGGGGRNERVRNFDQGKPS